MYTFMEPISRVKLGPLPVPYIFVIVLVPLWTFFSSHENSLLFSMFIILSVIVKGSLIACWILNRTTSPILQVTVVSGAMVIQMILLQITLHASLLSLIILVPPSTFTGICLFKLHLWNRKDEKNEDLTPNLWRKQVIGIFSRSSQEEYAWLTSILSQAGRVIPFSITNSNSMQFRQQVSECTFGILYHSKTRGRVNITNVTDSLYDEELEYMSQVLGKSNVIVVADDMDDSSTKTEQNILKNQSSIAKQSRGLYLFTTREKKDEQLRNNKVQPIFNIISPGSFGSIISDSVLVFLAVAPWIYFIYYFYDDMDLSEDTPNRKDELQKWIRFLLTTNLNGSILLYSATCVLNPRDSLLPSTHPTHRPRTPLRSREKKKGARVAGLVAALTVMVVELFFLYSMALQMDTIFLAVLSLWTSASILKMSTS